MKDESKTKKQLINELVELRKNVTELETSKAERKQAEETIKSYQFIVESARDAIFFKDLKNRYVIINNMTLEVFGSSKEEIIGKNDYEIMPNKEEAKKNIEDDQFVFTTGKPKEITKHMTGTDGKEYWFQAIKVPRFDDKGNIVGLVGIARDITERKRADEAIRESEERYHSLVDSTEDSIYLVDGNYKYLFINKKHLSRLGLSGDEYLGCAYSDLHSPDDTKWFVEKASKVFSTGESIIHEHKSLSDGRYFLLTLSPVKKPDGTITSVTVISKDVTELKSMEEELKALALTDELTGLYNRRGFFALVEQLLKLSKRQKTGMFMLYADVDNLKEINDTWGHKEGDLVLIDIANILKKNYRESDIIGRIGGDEFVVIPVGTTGDNIEEITARLQKSIQVHNAKGNRSYKLSLSLGTAYYDPENPCSVDELLAQGDKLMYEQKRYKQKS